MDLGLAGKVAMVTAGTRGIGLHIARALAAEGAKVAVVARTAADVERVARELGGAGVTADLTAEAGWRAAYEAVRDRLGAPLVLVNNFGLRAGSTWDDTGVAELEAAMAGNLYPAVGLSRLALPAMKAAGWGRVVVVSSVWGREAGGAPAYNAAKAAENSFVTSLGREVGGAGITVNAVAPGSVLEEGNGWWRRREADPQGMADFVSREMPLGRFGTAPEVAAVVTFLCSVQASYVNAAVVAVDGGQHRSNL